MRDAGKVSPPKPAAAPQALALPAAAAPRWPCGGNQARRAQACAGVQRRNCSGLQRSAVGAGLPAFNGDRGCFGKYSTGVPGPGTRSVCVCVCSCDVLVSLKGSAPPPPHMRTRTHTHLLIHFTHTRTLSISLSLYRSLPLRPSTLALFLSAHLQSYTHSRARERESKKVAPLAHAAPFGSLLHFCRPRLSDMAMATRY